MAENKKSFVLYSDLIHNIDHLTNEEKGLLFQHLLEYVNDMSPILEDRLLVTAWKPIERQLKRDLQKFEDVKDVRSGLGSLGNLKRWNLDLYTKVKENELTIEKALLIAKGRKASLGDSLPSLKSQSIANVADSVNDNVNVNVNVNENEINNKTNTRFNFRKSLIDLGANKELASEWIKVRKTKKATNSKTAFNNFEKETKKSKYSIDEILKVCVVKSWSGFKSSWDLEDSIDKEAIRNPSNEELIRFNSNVNPTVFKLPKSQFLELQEKNRSGGYEYEILA